MLKGIGDIASMLKQASEMQGRITEAREKVSGLRVEGIAGGEMVKVEATGELKILAVSIDPSLLESGDREMVEELVAAAANQALQKAKEAAAAAMSDAASGLGIPGLNEALTKFGMGG